MKLEWIGQACFYIQAQDGRRIVIDPFQRVIGLKRGELPADVAVFSHTHIDHCDPGIVADGTSVVMGPGLHQVGGFRFFGVHAYHDKKEGLLSGSLTLFSFVVDGFRIIHLSDLGEDLDDQRIEQLGKPDILLFPAGEHTTLSLPEVEALIKRFSPAIAVPMSFHLPGLLMPAASREKVEKTFPKYLNGALIELIPGQKFTQGTQIRILDARSFPLSS